MPFLTVPSPGTARSAASSSSARRSSTRRAACIIGRNPSSPRRRPALSSRTLVSRILACTLGLFAAMAAGASFAQTRIGFVSLDRILRDAAPAQRAQKKIEAEFAKRDQELIKSADQIKRLQDSLDKTSVT